MKNIKLKAKNIIKSKVIHHKKAMIMQNSNQVLGNKFNNLYFYEKRKNNIKIKCSTSLKREGHVESKFDRLNFHAKSSVKSEKYHKIKFDTPLKSYKILD